MSRTKASINLLYIVHFLWIMLTVQSAADPYPWMRKLSLQKSRNRNKTDISLSFNTKFRRNRRIDEIRRTVCTLVQCPDVEVGTIEIPTKPNPKIPPPSKDQDAPLFSEPSPVTNESTCMQFRLPNMYMKNDYVISGADVYVYVKMSKKAMKRKRKKKIVIKISNLDEVKNKKRSVARLKFRPVKTNYYKIALPLSILKKLKRQGKNSLQVCIDCKRCNKRVRVTFLRNEKKIKKKKMRNRKTKMNKKKLQKNRAMKSRPLSKNRPFLLLKARDASRRVKRDVLTNSSNQCYGNSTTQPCCTTHTQVSFRDMGLRRYIVYPNGFIFSHCLGICPVHITNSSSVLHTQNSTHSDDTCQPVKFEPLHIFVVFNDEIGYITLRKGIVYKCACD